MSANRFAELAEAEASGAIARIYEEIRRYSAVPYVSSLQRHVATMPGCLEWAWAGVRPAMTSGALPEAAWRVADAIDVPHLPKLSAAALRLFGVDDSGIETIRGVCDNFVRVSPVNLLTAACIRKLLAGDTPSGPGFGRDDWRPPAMLPALPAMVDVGSAPADQRAVMLQLSRDMAGQAFVPGPYRMFAHWPGYLAHVATELGALFDDPAVRAACDGFRDSIEAEAPTIFERLPAPPPDLPPPDTDQKRAILAALDVYRRTSPEMVVFGRMLREALP